jgi:hypothetical protein
MMWNRGYTLGDDRVGLVGLWRVGAVATQHGEGRPTTTRKTSAKKENKSINNKIQQHLPRTGRFPKPANKTNSTMADIHTHFKADMHHHFA